MLLVQNGLVNIVSKIVSFSLVLIFVLMGVFAAIPSPVLAASIIITAAYPDLGAAAACAFQLNGNASAQTGYIQLTPDSSSKWGSTFRKNKITMPSNFAFDSYFTFEINRSSKRADGLAFIIQGTTSSAGGSGQDLGFTGIVPGFAVEFDTYTNGSYGDPSDNHIGIITNGTANHTTMGVNAPVAIPKATFDLASGNIVHAWVEYDGTNVKVRLGTSNDRTAAIMYLDQAFDIGALFGIYREMYFGFSAATGGEYEEHLVRSCYFNNSDIGGINTNANTYTSSAPSITITANPTSAAPGGTSQICVNVKDASCNNLPVQTISFITTSGTLSAPSAVTDASGNACVTLTGPSLPISSIVRASHASGTFAETVVAWIVTPDFSNLTTLTINCGSTPTVISGTIKAGIYIPPGNVSITLNGVAQAAAIDSGNGNFSFSFNTGALNCGPYTINYSYAGSTNFNPVSGTGTLTVPCQLPPVLSNLSSPTINCGIPTAAISGNIKSGIYIPPGNVSITLNGVAQLATIDTANGDFNFSFNTSGLACCGTYAITYNYAGTTCYIPVAAAGTLTVRCPVVTQILSPPPVSSSPQLPERFVTSPANMVVTNLNVQPQQAQVIQPVTIYANIANRGDESGSYSATLKINGVVEETRAGQVGGRAAVPLQFVVSKDKPGTYNVDINGQQTSFIIIDDGGNKHIPTQIWVLIGFFLCAFGVIIALALLLRRRLTDE